MTLPRHAPGLAIDAHEVVSPVHVSLPAGFVASATVAGAGQIVPPGAVLEASAASGWYVANFATFHRFYNPYKRGFRYINLEVGLASGNIQVGVLNGFRRQTGTDYATRIMSSGIIACPAAGAARIDCGETILPAGDCVLFLWCDNITAQFRHGLATGLAASRMLFAANMGAGGVGTAEVALPGTTRWVTGLTLEADLPV